MSVKYPNYVNLTSSSEEQPNERTPSPPPRKKSVSPPQAPSKSISSKSTHYTSSSSPKFVGTEHGFLSQKGSRVGRGVKEKNLDRNRMDTTSGIGLSTKSDDTMNEDTPVVVASVVKEVFTPPVVDMTVEKEKRSSLDDTTILGSFPPLPTGNGIDVVVPVESIRDISKRFANTAYGFFLGKRVAYPVVANYVRNTWGKYGLVHSMFSSSTGLFSFQFSSIDGLDAMLENGPWFIRNHPLILKKWHLDENLLKEDVSTILVWVKPHGVHVTAFNKDSLSVISNNLSTPIMLDSYTSDMCMQSWGRSSYARVMIELRADVELKDNIVVAMPKIIRCASCKVFEPIHEECPKNTCAGEKKTLKKPGQTARVVSVGTKMGFKPQKEYRPVPKKPTAYCKLSTNNQVKVWRTYYRLVIFKIHLKFLNFKIDNDVELGFGKLLTSGEKATLGMMKAGNPLKKVMGGYMEGGLFGKGGGWGMVREI
ncbi:zinc finger, CCHC-type containing protein [Tanacetum coccineum]